MPEMQARAEPRRAPHHRGDRVSVHEIPYDPDDIGRQYGEEPPIADEPRRVGGVRWRTAPEFVAEEIPELRWLCTEILPERAIGYIGGAPKVLKSWIALDLAFAVAAGGAF